MRNIDNRHHCYIGMVEFLTFLIIRDDEILHNWHHHQWFVGDDCFTDVTTNDNKKSRLNTSKPQPACSRGVPC